MEVLYLKTLNLQIASNKKAHHTDDYQWNPELIVRRKQPFQISMGFNRPPQHGDRVIFTAAIGPNASESNGRKLNIPVTIAAESDSWSAVLDSSYANTITVNITSPADAIIGCYKMGIMVFSHGYVYSNRLPDLIMLFNPWAEGDPVYLPGEDKREEYVLNDYGIIYQGNVDHISKRGWNYGQFEKNILNCSFALLDKNSTQDYELRGDPIHITRVLSAMINSNDDNGVLIGNWSKDYAKGESPLQWNGSVDILQRWLTSGSVRYGQCWVFAGVLCTVMRSLGIPTRVVTNYNSAHDTNCNLSVDEFYDPLGKYIGTIDSVWNFHVWNEAWFARKDLGKLYDGWQAVDATPQEASSGIFRLGPASINAVKMGDTDLNYDVAFVFSEANADRVGWVYDAEKESLERIASDTTSIGQFMRTKAVGSDGFEDVTGNYKHQEGSTEERNVYAKAVQKLFGPKLNQGGEGFMSTASADSGRIAARAPTVETEAEITGKFKKFSQPMVGQDINLILHLTNNTPAVKAVKLTINAASTNYTRREMNSFMNNSQSVTLGPNEDKDISVKIPYQIYKPTLTAHKVIEVTALCQVGQGGKVLVSQTITLKSPSIDFKVDGQVVVNEKAKVDITFFNPLPEELKNCELHAEGSGLIESKIIQILTLQPKQKMSIPIEFTPYTKGIKQLQIIIKCNPFLNIKGFQRIAVAEAP